MDTRKIAVLTAALFLFGAAAAGAQESATNASVRAEESVAPAASQDMAMTAKADTTAPEWVWGEVTSVEAANNQFMIKHLDYETYEEVTKTIKVDPKTLFENVSGLSDMKIGDRVTIDYKTSAAGATAELVVVEKEKPAGTAESAEAVSPAEPAESAANAASAAENVAQGPPEGAVNAIEATSVPSEASSVVGNTATQ